MNTAAQSRKRAARKGLETWYERDEAVRSNLPADLLPLWERVRANILPRSTPEERTVALLEYAETHPDEVVAALDDEADRKVRALIRDRARRDAECSDVPF